MLLNNNVTKYIGRYSRLIEYNSPDEMMLNINNEDVIFYARQDKYNNIPGAPIAYWISEGTANNFIKFDKLSSYCENRVGLDTGDNRKILKELV